MSRVLVLLLVAAFVPAGAAGADGTPLRGVVGPGFGISLTEGSGSAVKNLDPGRFSLVVDDMSDEHNFHLLGPGVDVTTDVGEVGQKAFAVTLADGKYTFLCDVHPTRMTGSFTVGAAAAVPPPAVTVTSLVVTVTAAAVRLTTTSGKPVTALKSGPVVFTVRDRSASRGLRLNGAGVSRTTGVRFVGTLTWKVRLSVGALVYSSDPRKPVLRGGRVSVS